LVQQSFSGSHAPLLEPILFAPASRLCCNFDNAFPRRRAHRYTQIFKHLILIDICRVGKVFFLPTNRLKAPPKKNLPTRHFDLCITMSAGVWEREKTFRFGLESKPSDLGLESKPLDLEVKPWNPNL